MDAERIERTFTYQSPKSDQPVRYEAPRSQARELVHSINELCPESHEKDVAIDRLGEAVMWANAAIARNE